MTDEGPIGDPHSEDAGRSRRVAMVLTGTSFGGAEQIALSLATGLVEHGWQPIIVHRAGSSLETLASRCDALGVPRIAVRSMRGLRGLAQHRTELGQTAKATHRPDGDPRNAERIAPRRERHER